MRQTPALFVAVAVAALELSLGGIAGAQTISMTPAPATPELHAPFLWAARPATPLLFTIPTTGQAPLSFSATGLPAGLTMAADSGTITGMTPAAGAYPIGVTVSNASGTATATYTITASNTYALSPPMGWNSYDSFGSSIKEQEFLDGATAMKTYLAPYGWNTAVIDYLWFDNEQMTDSNGRWIPSPSKWPSSAGGVGLKAVGDKIHAMGLNFGIHIMRGIPRKSVTANPTIANSTYKAADAGNSADTCPWDTHNYGVRGDMPAGQAWYDSIFAQYATWGLDFVKVDDMVSGTNYHQSEVQAIRAAIDKTGRSIVLSLSPGPMQTADTANLQMNANMWRTVNDFWDTNGLSNLGQVFDAAGSWQMQTTLTAGHWPDCDMLPLGYIGPRSPVGGGNRTNNMTALTHNDQVAVMSLWGIMPSPLIYGGNPSHLTGDTWTIALLTNPEVIAINQDLSGAHAKRISSSTNAQVWTRDLSGGRKAVALFNRSTSTMTISTTFSQLGITGTPTVRDVWQRMDVTGMTTGLSASLPGGGAAMYVVSPPGSTSTGTGGNGGTGSGGAGGGPMGQGGRAGSAGSSGNPGSGGIAGTSGAGGTSSSGGTTGSGGTSSTGGTTGSGGTSSSGGTTGSGGTSSSGGIAGSGGTTGTGGIGSSGSGGGHAISGGGSDSGCSCTASGSGTGGGMPLVLLAGALARLRLRRKSR